MMQNYKNIYISLPITGNEDTWIEREKALVSKVRRAYPSATIITPSDINPVGCGKSYARCMADCLHVLLDCTTTHIVFADNYQCSRGCQLEYHAANIYNKIILHEKYFSGENKERSDECD